MNKSLSFVNLKGVCLLSILFTSKSIYITSNVRYISCCDFQFWPLFSDMRNFPEVKEKPETLRWMRPDIRWSPTELRWLEILLQNTYSHWRNQLFQSWILINSFFNLSKWDLKNKIAQYSVPVCYSDFHLNRSEFCQLFRC